MSFDTLAPHYRWMEKVLAGELLQRARTRWIQEITQSGGVRRALLAGEGAGRFLDACRIAWPDSDFLVIDQSTGMLRQAQRAVGSPTRSGRVRFAEADLLNWTGDEAGFDLIATHFFLDCFSPDELSRVISNLASRGAARCRWLLTDFCEPPAGWRRWRARVLLALAYAFFSRATRISARRITKPDDRLRAAGFELRGRAHLNFGMIQADWWERGRGTGM